MRTPALIVADMDALIAANASEAAEALSDEQTATYEALEAELQAVNKTGALFARHAAYKTPILGFPAVIKPTPKGDEALEFAFDQYLRTGQANSDMAHLFAQTEGTTTQGGYLVPPGFRMKLQERLKSFGGLRTEAENIDTGSGNPIEWPTVDATGADADIAAEGAATAAGADIVFGTKTLGAYKYTSAGTANLPIKVSFELLQDSAFDVSAFVTKVLGSRIGRKQAADLQVGSGSGAPLGLLYASGAQNVDLASSDAITYLKLLAVVHSVDPAYRDSAKWIFNDATAMDIESILDSTGRPLLRPLDNGIESSVKGQGLLGYPVVIDNSAPTKADEVPFAAFGDLNAAYIVRNVRDIQVLVNPYAVTGYIVYDAWARMDGTIQDAFAYATLTGETS